MFCDFPCEWETCVLVSGGSDGWDGWVGGWVGVLVGGWVGGLMVYSFQKTPICYCLVMYMCIPFLY